MELDNLFNECINEEKYSTPNKDNFASINTLIKDIEAEFQGLEGASPAFDREKEKDSLVEKIKVANNKLKLLTNPSGLNGNSKKRAEVTEKISKQRDILRKEIARYKVRLSEIEVEENASHKQEKKEEKKVNECWNSLNPYADL